MKKFYIPLVFVLIFSLSDAFSQSVSINTDGSNADASSILDVKATDKGVLVPRVSLTDVTSASPVSSPASGLLVYNTNATVTGGHGVGFYVWNGTSWIKLVQDNDGAFIRNQNTTDQTANFRITGIGRANTSFQSPIYTRADAGTVAIRPHTDATNAIQLQNAAGTPILNVDATNQRVGIGTVSPSQKLDVQGGNARINNTFIGDVGHGATWGGFSHSSQNTTTGYALLQSSDGAFTLLNKLNTNSGYIGFRVSNTDVAVITNAGNMGIGTTTPTNTLQILGSARVGLGAGVNNIYLNAGATIGNGGLEIFTNNNVAYIRYHDPNIAWRNIALNNAGGNVGIRTDTPAFPLDVNGTINSSTTFALQGSNAIFGNNNDIYANVRVLQNNSTALQDGMYINYNSTGGTNAHLRFYANGITQRMFINANNGNITIGDNTNVNNAKLNVIGTAGFFTNTYRWFNFNSGPGGPCNNCTAPYSLYTSGRIWCAAELNITSDERTKEIKGISNKKSDLELINKLEVIEYQYIDKVNKGVQMVKGFSAQQVEKVYPDAINLNTEIIPNIYQLAKSFTLKNGYLTIEIDNKNTRDYHGKNIKLIGDFGEKTYKIIGTSKNTITVENFQEDSDWIFVFGTEEHDVRNLDYNKIFSVGISAIQELSNKVNELESENLILKNKIKEVDSLKAEILEIKSALEIRASK